MSDGKKTDYDVTADELTRFVERAEHLIAEKKDITEQEKELYAEAKGRGYDTKILRKVIALRARNPDEVAEEEAVLDMYKKALKMR
jgi:uncharacterized protein (UPF0335 family)